MIHHLLVWRVYGVTQRQQLLPLLSQLTCYPNGQAPFIRHAFMYHAKGNIDVT
jgi:hypothetical protein